MENFFNKHNEKPSKGERLHWAPFKTAQPVKLNENVKPERVSEKDLAKRQAGKLLVP